MALRGLGYALTVEAARPTPAMRKEAIECWRALTALDHGDRDAHYELAKAWRQAARWSYAEKAFREVLRIGQTSHDSDVWVYWVHNELGETLEKQGKTVEAEAEYRALVLVQREMERGRSPLVSIPPFGRGFSRHRGLPIRCGVFEKRGSEAAALRSSSR